MIWMRGFKYALSGFPDDNKLGGRSWMICWRVRNLDRGIWINGPRPVGWGLTWESARSQHSQAVLQDWGRVAEKLLGRKGPGASTAEHEPAVLPVSQEGQWHPMVSAIVWLGPGQWLFPWTQHRQDLDSCIQVWTPHNKKDIEVLEQWSW